MKSEIKLGSLFDGSGGFPLAGVMCGITPVWASEVEPYPIAITKHQLPAMRHLGDVSRIHGGEIEPVDIITFGSPCQDMSIAGKRKGLQHTSTGDSETTRSGLFFEAVRIIREMRDATNGAYPTIAIWENVHGAYSSNKGEDFRRVLQEFVSIAEPCATVPPMPRGGWPYADCYVGDGWSLAYRLFDAQYWGVPQRRRRVYAVADFGGGRAPKILFERKGLHGYFTQSGKAGEAATGDVAVGTGGCGVIPINTVCYPEVARSLCARHDGSPCTDRRKNVVAHPLTVFCCDARGNGNGQIAQTLTGDHQNRVSDYTALACYKQQQFGVYTPGDIGTALKARDYKDAADLVVSTAGVDCRNLVVRRLTPTECQRLQGFGDNWGKLPPCEHMADVDMAFWDGVRKTWAEMNGKRYKPFKSRREAERWYNKLYSDSAEYKMWGNGLALPTALYVMQGVAGVLGA